MSFYLGDIYSTTHHLLLLNLLSYKNKNTQLNLSKKEMIKMLHIKKSPNCQSLL